MKHFYFFLYGKNSFTIFTGHKPLISLFEPNSKLPTLVAARLQRLALTLTEFLTYARVKYQQNIDKECILKANRVIVPVKLKDKVLEMLHSEHLGISKTKNLARYYVWWPKIDEDWSSLANLVS